jgi:predicted tellurium resistance membrane protein TerC
MIEAISDPNAWVALLSLTLLEIVLGIDNIVFIAILADRLPEEQQKRAYQFGLMGALVTRLALLCTISWIIGLTEPFWEHAPISFAGIEVGPFSVSGQNVVLFLGGLFLIAKSVHEIYEKVEKVADNSVSGWGQTLSMTIVQIMILDVVFSLDSVITAVGMAEELWVMVTAIIIAVFIMLFFAKPIGDFVNRHPSMKILALAFLLLIGVLLTAEGLGQHVGKGYIYTAMVFALSIELLNIRRNKKIDMSATPTLNSEEAPHEGSEA